VPTTYSKQLLSASNRRGEFTTNWSHELNVNSAFVSRRGFLAIGGALGVGAVLAACSGQPGGAGKPGNLPFWYYFRDVDEQRYFQTNFIDGYKGSIPAQLRVVPLDEIDRLTQTALAAGKGPALVMTSGPSAAAVYSEAGYLADLSKYAETYGWNEKFAGWSLEASKVGGKLVTLPTSYETMLFYFNPAVLDKHGLTPPKSRDEFEAFCEESSGKGLVPISSGNANWQGVNVEHITVFMNHYAGPEAVYSALTGETPWTDPVFVETIDLLNSYFQKGWYGGGVESYFTNQYAKLYESLASGEAAGMISGSWDLTNLNAYFGEEAGNDATWEWTTLPSLREGVPDIVWDLGIGSSAGLNANFEDVDAAAEFLNFLTTDKETLLKAVADVNRQLPPIQLAASDFPESVDPRVSKLYEELASAESIGYTTWTFWPQKTQSYMTTEFERVLTGQMDAAEFCAGVQEIFSEEFAAGGVPVPPKPGGKA
jgi:raffinose/stachyose/melibiose transport system substrate-binding protein